MNQSLLARPLNASLAASLEPAPLHSSQPVCSEPTDSIPQSPRIRARPTPPKGWPKSSKVMLGCGVCLFVVGLLAMLVLPGLIHGQIVTTVTEQATLTPDNEGMWAHIPGQTATIITRNYSFFQIVNEEEFLIQGKKPKFIETYGYKVQELQDFLEISYNQYMTKVTYKDWLHFQNFPQSRSLEQKVKILNVPSIGYWNILKHSRTPIIFIQGFSLMFTNLQSSLIDTVVGQGISSQYLPDPATTFSVLLQPSGMSIQNSFFMWNDDAYGFGDKNNLRYWVEAARTSFTMGQQSFSTAALELKDYFTLSDSQLYSILTQISQYSQSLHTLIIQNHYCHNISNCNGHELAIRQIASSYVTANTPPVSSITPTDTICSSNATCFGYYPEIAAYYKNVYLSQYPQEDPFLTFDVGMVREWLEYNPTGQKGEYSRSEAMLMHIGNLDALFANGTKHDQLKKSHTQTTEYLINIKDRFRIKTEQQARVFWEWVKYLAEHLVRQGTGTNQILGIANSFSSTLYSGFSFLQNNLQLHLLKAMLQNRLSDMRCHQFLALSYQSTNQAAVEKICNQYNMQVNSQQFVGDSVKVCRNKYKQQWNKLRALGATGLNLQAFCDKSVKGGFGQLYHTLRVQLNDFYQCVNTPNEYCSDYELALKQWANSTVTLRHPPSTKSALTRASTFAEWNSSASPIQLFHYAQKTVNKTIPIITVDQAYHLFNFEGLFSASYNLAKFKNKQTSEQWRNYMRYVVIFIAFKIGNVRTAREYMFGYNDEYLLWRKNRYPPFGGDPATPAYTAFNDLNLTKEETVLQIELHTGKDSPLMSGQYSRINGLTYLTQNFTRFNGNETYWVLESPWGELDYFYGTNGKKFAPDQATNKNISIYVPNLQRYGSAVVDHDEHYQRYGYELEIAKLGEYMYLPMEQSPDNAKYYQHYYGLFNETSVLGFPFFMSKHHFLNSSANWTTFVDVYDEQGVKIEAVDSPLEQSRVIYEPYSGVAFQSTLYLQANYFHQPDQLFTYPQPCLLPVFSINRSGNLTQETANQLFQPLTTALQAKVYVFYFGLATAILGVVLCVYAAFRVKVYRNRTRDLTNDEPVTNMSIKSQDIVSRTESQIVEKPQIEQKGQ